MKTIEKLIKEEADILSRYRGNREKEYTGLQSDIKSLLLDIGSCYDSIDDPRKLKWIYNAIIRWESFLSSKFGIYVTTPIPSIDTLRSIANTFVIPFRLPKLSSPKKTAMFGDLDMEALEAEFGDPPHL